ncbi:hypothetical protein CC78DRAFT_33447 [Lojkania enalia]|uniref:Zn(2)-C6 fungal-type domain-containing protein n=1 Tax=Lojkania enalia TaxID=147567 RepID=A0A9P4KG71_9PLEO|nr:hypothetical protein CC78DRAFT_33447 [Didymosphaeria enalia]
MSTFEIKVQHYLILNELSFWRVHYKLLKPLSMASSGIEKRGSSATVRACDSCRKRKRKCVWLPGAESCTPCSQVKGECLTTHIRKPRAKSQKRNRIAEYESRIQRLEALLEERTAAQPSVEEQPLQPADQSRPLSEWVGNLLNEVNSVPMEQGPELGLSAIASGFEGFDNEDLTFPISSDESLAQPTPGDLLLDVSNEEGFISNRNAEDVMLAQQSPLDPMVQVPMNGPESSEGSPFITRARCDGYLPHPDLGTALLSEFLVDFNTATPLYRPHKIAQHLRICYTGASDGSALAWANTYVVFGLAHRLRAMSAAADPRDNEQADYYLKRVLSSVPDLLLTGPSLALIQCLLALAILIQTTSHSTPYALFVATAVRMAQCLAYNDDQMREGDITRDVEQERRVFWIALMLDTEASLLSNGPTTHRRDDIAARHPEDNPHDSAGSVTAAEGEWRVNYFSIRTRLILIESEAIEHVLSIKARKTTPQDKLATARRILGDLKAFRTHELFQLNAEQLMQLLYRSDLVHVVTMEASYFAIVFRLQWFLALGLDARINPFSADALERIARMKSHACHKDARRFLTILSVAPQGDLAVSW